MCSYYQVLRLPRFGQGSFNSNRSVEKFYAISTRCRKQLVSLGLAKPRTVEGPQSKRYFLLRILTASLLPI